MEVEAAGGFGAYPLDARMHDECFDTDGRVRPAYRRLVTYLSGLTPQELAAKAEAIELSLRARGSRSPSTPTATTWSGRSRSTWCPGW